TAKDSVFSSSDYAHIQDLKSRFERFKQQFDRGLSVQSVLNLETILTEIETGGQRNWPKMQNLLSGHSDSVVSVGVSPDGRYIVSGSSGQTIRIWDAETGEAIGSPFSGHTDSVTSVAFLPNGKSIVTGSRDHTIRLWDTEAGQMVGEPLKGHTDSILTVKVSGNGKYIASGSDDGNIRVWDAQSGEAIGYQIEQNDRVESIDISPD
ncbi:16296_t:CDS:2, partial [Acaulospora colombiana]